ncbi:MAG: MraY family glycosyltransferase [Coriobacteriaceae bacterium]|nr:MraY family glycosyltransferase [Coriobacteriaceae bacterium]
MPRYWLSFFCLFAASLACALAVTPLARRIAIRVGAVDYPNKRRVNKTPTPRMGGIAIFAGIVVAFAVQYIGTSYFDWPVVLVPSPRLTMNYWMLVLAFAIIFATGLLDDKYTLTPRAKLAGQVLAATVAAMGGLVIGVIANPFEPGEFIELGWLTYPVTIVYLVAYVNIINLIDGLDGLAAGISCIASVTMFVLSIWADRLDAAALACAIAGSTLGFLRYNFHPASIFMGDSGSLTLGFALGTISLLSVTRIAGLTTIIVPLVIAGIPIIDTFSAIVRRTRAHVSVGRADRGHIHHRLLAEGFDQRQAVLVVYAWTALLCAGALVMTQVTTVPRICIFLVLLAASGAFANHLHLFEPVLRHHKDPRTGDDELVGPDDPAFAEESERARERREERREGLLGIRPDGGDKGKDNERE